MQFIKKILKFEFSNVIRSRWIIFFFSFFFLVSYSLFTFESNIQKSLLSLFNLIIYLVPLISLVFGTMYFYNSREYIEMMLGQPIPRSSLYLGLYFGTTLPIILSLILGIIPPFILFSNMNEGFNFIILLSLIGSVLNFISIAVAFLISTSINDKVKGLSLAIFFWLLTAIAFDGILLLLIYIFSDYPIEKFLLLITLINPINLSRTLFVLNFDISALMGFTGAIFKKFYGSALGSLVSGISLIIWIIIPFWMGLKKFKSKDF